MRYAMIMAGGSGTRLWPMSRDGQPKQLIRFIHRPDGSVASLLQLAAERAAAIAPHERCFVCTGERYRDQILRGVPGITDDRILGEPEPRDTVNAVAFAAAVFARQDPAAVFAVLTADQLITPAETFQAAIDRGFRLVEEDPTRLVTFGITPTHPATGYGYIEQGGPIGSDPAEPAAFAVERFVEKPPLDKARAYLASGRFFWNAGMFVFQARQFLDLYERFLPENAEGLRRIAHAWDTPNRRATLEAVYPTLKKTSVDYGIMEPASADPAVSIVGVEMPVRWLDVGSWPTYAETVAPDADDNRVAGLRLAAHDARSNVVIGEGGPDADHLVALVGCENLIVVRTARATLVMPRERAEELKALHASLEQADR